jgi:3-methyladenine DNA glycosylase AlkD
MFTPALLEGTQISPILSFRIGERNTKYEEIIDRLKAASNRANVEGMARFGINPDNTLGVSLPILRKLAREAGRDHTLAQRLWNSGIHEARIVATMIDSPQEVSEAQMEAWVRDFDSWDVCDQCCSNLFDKTSYAHKKSMEWSSRPEEFVKRAGFVLMATMAVHDKKASDVRFQRYFRFIKRESDDDRNFVKKAVNWALRQIGKRNQRLNKEAIEVAKDMRTKNSKAARWIGADALRELTSESVQRKVRRTRQS